MGDKDFFLHIMVCDGDGGLKAASGQALERKTRTEGRPQGCGSLDDEAARIEAIV